MHYQAVEPMVLAFPCSVRCPSGTVKSKIFEETNLELCELLELWFLNWKMSKVLWRGRSRFIVGPLKYLNCVPSLIVLEERRPLTEIRRCQRCSSCPCVWCAASFWGSVVCVYVLLREESLKWKTKREMWPSPLFRRKRVWCWTMSHSSKPVMVYTHPQTYEALWLCVVVAGLCNGWVQMLFDILCLRKWADSCMFCATF